jgi:aspartyl-tRNA(Asn)/glutamyl-tRNA(Gln) amidotransferase subunit C
MAITPEEVRRIAELARLEIPPEREGRMVGELSAVLEFVATLDRLDLAGCESTSFASTETPLREDVPDGRRLTNDQALEMAPSREHGFFLVPPIVENVNP